MKTPPAPPREKTVYGRRLLIMRIVYTDKPIAFHRWALLPSDMYDGKEVTLHDWKADDTTGKIYVRGAFYIGYGQYHQFEDTLNQETEEVALKPPGRNFEWSSFDGQWRNTKTGERRRPW